MTIEGLKRLADAAGNCIPFATYVESGPDIGTDLHAESGMPVGSLTSEAHAQFVIAANPSTVLSLIERVERAEALVSAPIGHKLMFVRVENCRFDGLNPFGNTFGGPEYFTMDGAFIYSKEQHAAIEEKIARAEKAQATAREAEELFATPIAILQERAHEEGRLAGEQNGYQRGMEDAAKICERTRDAFLDPAYAGHNPASSFLERFGANQCVQAIREKAEAGKQGEG